ncbi:hypothetical protein [Kineosporia sp. R_H_3]|uniref:hypothetical protein n=1 Tax=Kineosporia sp. R_H_3 TaxID=1961848 RepID=UPI000B4AAC44|nr:hypothetical protein [Kineosporia sp. R_H_3]
MSHNDVIIDTTPLPAPTKAVWSPQDRILIVSDTATHAEAAAAWAKVSSRPFPGLPEQRRSA